MELTRDEWATVRTALLVASMVSATQAKSTEDALVKLKLHEAKWTFLKLAERIGAEVGN